MVECTFLQIAEERASEKDREKRRQGGKNELQVRNSKQFRCLTSRIKAIARTVEGKINGSPSKYIFVRASHLLYLVCIFSRVVVGCVFIV